MAGIAGKHTYVRITETNANPGAFGAAHGACNGLDPTGKLGMLWHINHMENTPHQTNCKS